MDSAALVDVIVALAVDRTSTNDQDTTAGAPVLSASDTPAVGRVCGLVCCSGQGRVGDGCRSFNIGGRGEYAADLSNLKVISPFVNCAGFQSRSGRMLCSDRRSGATRRGGKMGDGDEGKRKAWRLLSENDERYTRAAIV
jgi:hypothetical protein